MPYRNKTYVCFDADNDIHYYRLLQAWKQSDHTPFNFYNAHELNTIRAGSQEATIKRSLRERLANSKVLVVLVGENTRYLYKFVRWEMEEALDLGLAIIAVNLNGKRSRDDDRCPPIIRDVLAIHISFNAAVLQHALERWEQRSAELAAQGASGPYYYKDTVYASLGL